ncbi:FHA domain-containing protein [Nocardioides caeni]|uniref:FHA domain-containing protein n=1 Tax=Nocardioides caeni TaxID=574700 RepID=A0A4S8NNW6_9ACTN|nr:FHA domain-containing protein [Nocardioides caeni]THV18265.1 FHA domain-containing protein [Nocardioides caeni]
MSGVSALVVEVDGRVLRLEGRSAFHIGRAIEADIVLTAGSVSRRHAEIRSVDGVWTLIDAGSQFGTFVDEQRITEHPIEQRVEVRCGPPAAGATLTVIPAEQYDDASATPSVPAPLAPMPDGLLDEPTSVPRPVTPGGEAPRPDHTAVAPRRAGAPDAPVPPLSPPPLPAAAAPGSERFAPPGAAPATPPGLPPAPLSGPPPVPAALPPVPQAPPAAGARPPGGSVVPPPIDGNEATQVLAAIASPGPVGQPGPSGPPPPRTGPDLLVVAEGREHRFRHPAQVTVGRRSDCTVVISDPACSRIHGRIDAHPGGWSFTNLSNENSFLDGRRVVHRAFDERTSLRLGHPVAGPELILVPILSAAEEERRIARRRWGRRLVVVGVVAAVLTLIGGAVAGAWLIGRDDDGDRRTSGSSSEGTAPGPDGTHPPSPGTDSMGFLSDAELDAAKAATVKITAETHYIDDPSSIGEYHGSGSIISSDGLILTNAHVAEPEAEGLYEQYGGPQIANPEYLLISLTDGMTDTNAPPAFRARVVAADGHLDAAVVQIYANADGSDLDGDLDLPAVEVGDSDDLRAGDDVTVLGFPAVAGSGASITVTTGVISTVLNIPELGPRSELDTDARIAPGNSGGMAVNNDGELIGIPTALQSDEGTTVTSGRIRSIDVVKDLIEEAEAAVG